MKEIYVRSSIRGDWKRYCTFYATYYEWKGRPQSILDGSQHSGNFWRLAGWPVLEKSPGAAVYDTRKHGKPDAIKITKPFVDEFKPKCVCVISNQRLTEALVEIPEEFPSLHYQELVCIDRFLSGGLVWVYSSTPAWGGRASGSLLSLSTPNRSQHVPSYSEFIHVISGHCITIQTFRFVLEASSIDAPSLVEPRSSFKPVPILALVFCFDTLVDISSATCGRRSN
ncbi:hypothetical protein EV421DRAFT_1953353 [Armillaria borealis]|uniref:Uncharacterized protein n=1 Tax=Armillaria borealis TaxID=47425 RepID=A0AA39MP96_9AGAR|nr:hypothetical protein EV421DRAFT_1953353 [Armillaria borealis]